MPGAAGEKGPTGEQGAMGPLGPIKGVEGISTPGGERVHACPDIAGTELVCICRPRWRKSVWTYWWRCKPVVYAT